ncbi:RNA polymerase subunit sigma-24 [Methylocella tundrae]|jgi:RNA polymerase sigma factor (sigma-70 family)|nr:sigma-70 family RNA polymerase sigma factor [Methylocella tundrae]VTZ27179.1 RNA polymerase subunit sigma-24 [Methylocella tundrae]
MTALTDRTSLIIAARSGDESSLNRLLRECRADIRRYAQRHCEMSEVDDAVQETLLIVARRIRSLKAATSFAGWLFTVVRRECRRLTRSMFHHEDWTDERIEAQLASRSDDALRLELASALESLPPHYLEIVLLRDFEELSISEISERLGAPASVVKSRLHRARVLVREYLIGADDGAAGPMLRGP